MQPHTQTRCTATGSQPSKQAPVLMVKTHIKAGSNPIGSTGTNHNETLVQAPDRRRPCGSRRTSRPAA
jgi:hypothetical protein